MFLKGYIPKGQHYFGERYAIFSEDAISHMEIDQQAYVDQQTRLRTAIKDQCMNGLSGNSQRKLPLQARSKKTKMYFPNVIQHSLSPYTYSNDDPRKYMLSGYTGFVPKSRETIGKSVDKIILDHFTFACRFTCVLLVIDLNLLQTKFACVNKRAYPWKIVGIFHKAVFMKMFH